MESRDDEIKSMVRERYASIAQSGNSCCAPQCCGDQSALVPSALVQISELGQALGYTKDQLDIGLGQASMGPNMGLGCGNPIGVADLKPGEQVVDLGSGAGFDAFLAARSVGPEGKVIGVDMTPEMIGRAQENAERLDVRNVEFRLGEIERLPVEHDSADVVLSNCVINLSPDKRAAYAEILRVLKPGGRISISDVLRSKEIPRDLKDNPSAYTG